MRAPSVHRCALGVCLQLIGLLRSSVSVFSSFFFSCCRCASETHFEQLSPGSQTVPKRVSPLACAPTSPAGRPLPGGAAPGLPASPPAASGAPAELGGERGRGGRREEGAAPPAARLGRPWEPAEAPPRPRAPRPSAGRRGAGPPPASGEPAPSPGPLAANQALQRAPRDLEF